MFLSYLITNALVLTNSVDFISIFAAGEDSESGWKRKEERKKKRREKGGCGRWEGAVI